MSSEHPASQLCLTFECKATWSLSQKVFYRKLLPRLSPRCQTLLPYTTVLAKQPAVLIHSWLHLLFSPMFYVLTSEVLFSCQYRDMALREPQTSEENGEEDVDIYNILTNAAVV